MSLYKDEKRRWKTPKSVDGCNGPTGMQSKPNVLDGPIGASELQQQAYIAQKENTKKGSFSTLSKYIENKSNQPSSIYIHGIYYTNSYTGSLKSAAACGLFWGGLVSSTNRNSTHTARRLFVPPRTSYTNSYNQTHRI